MTAVDLNDPSLRFRNNVAVIVLSEWPMQRPAPPLSENGEGTACEATSSAAVVAREGGISGLSFDPFRRAAAAVSSSSARDTEAEIPDGGGDPAVAALAQQLHLHGTLVLMCCRVDGRGWQFVQGGVEDEEDVIEAGRRELFEEVGLCMATAAGSGGKDVSVANADVQFVGKTGGVYRYLFPEGRAGKGYDGQQQTCVVGAVSVLEAHTHETDYVRRAQRLIDVAARCRLEGLAGGKREFVQVAWMPISVALERFVGAKVRAASAMFRDIALMSCWEGTPAEEY